MLDVSRRMKMGIVHPMLFPETKLGEGPILETIESIVKDPFFECIEVSWVRNDRVKKKAAHLMKMAQIDIVYTQGPVAYAKHLNPHALEAKERRRSLQEIKRSVDEALSLGARIFQMIGGPDPGPIKRKEATKYFVESLCEVCQYASVNAGSHNMIVSIENLDRDIHKKFLIGPTSEAVQVVESVRRDFPNIGLTLDLAHLPLLSEPSEAAVTMAQGYLVHVHLGNCILRNKDHARFGDTHPVLGVEGGEVGVHELAEFLRALVKIGFFAAMDDDRPIVSLEMVPSQGDSPQVLIAAMKRVFALAWDRVERTEKT